MIGAADAVPFAAGAATAFVGQMACLLVLRMLKSDLSPLYSTRVRIEVDGEVADGTLADLLQQPLQLESLLLRFGRDVDAITALVSAAALGVTIAVVTPQSFSLVIAIEIAAAAFGGFVWVLCTDPARYDRWKWGFFSVVNIALFGLNAALATIFYLLSAVSGHPGGVPSPAPLQGNS